MSVVFFGTPLFAVPSLDALLASGERLDLVITQPDRAQGRGHKVIAPPVKQRALAAGLRVIQPASLRDEDLFRTLSLLEAEFFVVVAYGKILPKRVLDLPARGCVNVHASLLPLYRGAAPVAWSIINGDPVTGVTTMLMDEGMDTGPTLLRSEIAIGDDDTTQTLSLSLSQAGAALLTDTLSALRTGTVSPQPQRGVPTCAPPLRKGDGRMDWTRSARELSCFVRGMSPWPGAQCIIDGEKVKILKVREVGGDAAPGVVCSAERGEFIVGTGKGLLSLVEVQPEGKRPMTAPAYLTGRRIAPGLVIG